MSRPINVLAIARLEDDEVRAIQEVDPNVTIRWSVNREETPKLLEEAEVILASWQLDINTANAPLLKWVHFFSAGIDHFFRCGHCDHQLAWDGERLNSKLSCTSASGHEPMMRLPSKDITITTSSGIAAIPIAEYALLTMLSLTRRLPAIVRAQDERRWIKQRHMADCGELYNATLGIVGFGHIGEQVALRAKGFGMRVIATRRSATDIIRGAGAAPADEVYPADRLHEVLAASDYVVLAAPLTPETEGMFGEAAFRSMKRSAFIINISRGRLVDEDAFVRALQEGWIAGGAADVTVKEPLPADHPMWAQPNMLITPHIAAVSTLYSTRGVELFCKNLKRYLDGEPLVNVLDRTKGY